LQEGFWEEHGLQCGYCTPGMIMATVTLLQDNPTPTERQIREGLSGNYCRCTGYQHIVNAIQHAAKKRKRCPFLPCCQSSAASAANGARIRASFRAAAPTWTTSPSWVCGISRSSAATS